MLPALPEPRKRPVPTDANVALVVCGAGIFKTVNETLTAKTVV